MWKSKKGDKADTYYCESKNKEERKKQKMKQKEKAEEGRERRRRRKERSRIDDRTHFNSDGPQEFLSNQLGPVQQKAVGEHDCGCIIHIKIVCLDTIHC